MTTFATKITDNTSVWHWLLRLEGQGIVLRYAEADIDVTEVARAYHYEGRIQIHARPSISVNPYTMVVSVANVGITILPRNKGETDVASPDRFQDFEISKNLNFHQLTGKLYRWAEGTVFSEAQLVLAGPVDSIQTSTDGTVTFDVIDYMHKYDVGLPKKQITEDFTSANNDDEGYGFGFPIRYNEFTWAMCPTVINGSDIGIVAGHVCSSLTAKYGDGAALPASLATGTHDDGETYSYVDFSTTAEHFHVTGIGHLDNVGGDYTGTGSGIIKHPCDIIHHCARNFANVPVALVNADAFRAARLWWPNWEMNLNIEADDNTTFFSAVNRLARYMLAAVFFESGKLTVRNLSFSNMANFHVTAGNLLDSSGVMWGSKEEVVNDLTIRYKPRYIYKYREGGFDKSVRRHKLNYPKAVESEILYGEKRAVLECKSVSSGPQVNAMADNIALLYHKPRKTAVVEVDRTSHDVKLAQTVALSEPLWPSSDGSGSSQQRTICIGIEYGLHDNRLTLLEV